MKVKDLIDMLKGCDPEAEIIIPCDDEGNFFNTVYKIDCGVYDTSTKEYHQRNDTTIEAVCLW